MHRFFAYKRRDNMNEQFLNKYTYTTLLNDLKIGNRFPGNSLPEETQDVADLHPQFQKL